MKQGLRHIRAFLAVAELGNFTRAAHALHVSQPALTVQIRQLEDELKVRLFDRDNRNVMLTTSGQSLLQPLKKVLADFDHAIEIGKNLAGLAHGTLTIAALPSIAADWLPDVLLRYRQAYSGIHIRVADVAADRLEQMVADDAVDLGLGTWGGRSRDISFTELQADRMHAFFPPGHPLEEFSEPTLSQVTLYPQVMTAAESSVRKAVHQALEAENLDIQIACEVAYLSTAIGMVKAGMGVAILPHSTTQAAHCVDLLNRPILSSTLTRRLGLLARARATPSPAAQAFVEMLKTDISPVPSSPAAWRDLQPAC